MSTTMMNGDQVWCGPLVPCAGGSLLRQGDALGRVGLRRRLALGNQVGDEQHDVFGTLVLALVHVVRALDDRVGRPVDVDSTGVDRGGVE